MRPQKGKAGGSFYMAGYKGGGGFGTRKSTAKELDPNSAYNDADLQAGQDVQHDFGDSSFDANNAQLPFNVGGGDNWFTRIFNPPNQTAIDANNAALMAKVAGGIQNQQSLDLAAKERAIQNDITARTVAPYLEPNSPLLGNNHGPLNQQALGERLGVALGKPLGDLGAANAVPLAELANYATGIHKQVAQSPGGQKALELGYLKGLVPDVHFGGNVLSFGMNPTAGGTMLEGGGEEMSSREMFPHWVDPTTGKLVLMPGGRGQIVTNKNYRPATAVPFNQFQGAGRDSVPIANPNPRPKSAPQPFTGHNEEVVPSENQPEPPSPYIRDENGYIGQDEFPLIHSPFLFEELRRNNLLRRKGQVR